MGTMMWVTTNPRKIQNLMRDAIGKTIEETKREEERIGGEMRNGTEIEKGIDIGMGEIETEIVTGGIEMIDIKRNLMQEVESLATLISLKSLEKENIEDSVLKIS